MLEFVFKSILVSEREKAENSTYWKLNLTVQWIKLDHGLLNGRLDFSSPGEMNNAIYYSPLNEIEL